MFVLSLGSAGTEPEEMGFFVGSLVVIYKSYPFQMELGCQEDLNVWFLEGCPSCAQVIFLKRCVLDLVSKDLDYTL